MTQSHHKRRIKLILPGLQLRLTGKFVGLAVLAMALQFLYFGRRLVVAMSELHGGSGDLAAEVPGMLLETLQVSMLVIVPIMVGFGVIFTFRIAGPMYRFEQYLAAVARGEETAPCRIRQGDELWSTCEKINAAVEPLLRRNAERQEADARDADASGGVASSDAA